MLERGGGNCHHNEAFSWGNMTGTLTRTHARASTHTDARTHARSALTARVITVLVPHKAWWESGRCVTLFMLGGGSPVRLHAHTLLFIAIVRGVYCTRQTLWRMNMLENARWEYNMLKMLLCKKMYHLLLWQDVSSNEKEHKLEGAD